MSTEAHIKNQIFGRRWREVRLRVLERDGYLCQIKGPKCEVTATAVDHIQRWRRGGAHYDERNLRAACTWCNNWAKDSVPVPADRRPSREW